ncbi:MAG: exodeoxyribonuclease V subunit gamma [Candidatus Thiodiazotropha sp. (ex Epidulcina cf. delphinae)]|nr:exodeoxyribonuclease V subunit gamma [Candidatus Thiodiazotropha sp. (ex Epidulcina cf. delphinae)]
MLRLYQSNRLEALAERLTSLLAEGGGLPLQPEQVVVQHPGMERWLSLRIACRLGICANLEFPLPAGFIWQCFHRLLPTVPQQDRYQPKRLSWRIHALLADREKQPSYRPVTDYLLGGGEVRRFQLAQRLAALFDRYLIYRPDWIVQWQQGKAATNGDEWQADLWRRLTKEDAVHWLSLQQRLSRLSPESYTDGLPSRVFIFGVPTLSPGYLAIIRQIALYIEVYLFLLNPCEMHWADIVSPAEQARLQLKSLGEELYLEVGNPLLASLGRQGRDFFAAVNEMDPGGEELFEAQPNERLLQRLQNQILHLQPPLSDCPPDNSITLHLCHSPMREVEVLYDQLPAMLEEIPGLTPADILVMAPDIDRYAPLINAVFSGPDNRSRIPFRVSDTSLQQSNSLAVALLKILQLPGSRYGVSELLNLLELAAVRRRFDLDEVGLEQVTQWLDQAGIRWGRDGESKRPLGLPPEARNTWQAGLRQLMLGYAMPSDGDELWRHIYPLDCAEGSGSQRLGSLLAFCDAVFSLELRLRTLRSPEAWMALLIDLTEQFFSADEATEPLLESVRETIYQMAQEAQEAGFHDPVSVTVMHHRLQEMFALVGDRGFLGGGVNFCALAPMRSLPFRVICLIGMNDDAFPRRQPELGFDLMAGEFRLGDRSRRVDDRYLFLETLISARDRLYLSYIGRNQRDNSLIPPSVAVDELRDTLRQMVGEEGLARITFDHPLQPFSPDYFRQDSGLFSYSSEMREAAMRVGRGTQCDRPLVRRPLAQHEDIVEIDLQQLLCFFTNPQRGFAQHRLDLTLESAELLPEEREPFILERFDQLDLEHALVESLLQGASPEMLYERSEARGQLPHGSVGEQTFEQMLSHATEMAERIRSLGGERSIQPLEIDLFVADLHLFGHLRGVSEQGLLAFSTGKLYPYLLIQHWIRHLVMNHLNPSGVAQQTSLLEQGRTGRFKPVEQAGSHLEILLRFYRRGLRSVLPFYPTTSWTYVEKLQQGDEEKALKAAREKWFGNRYHPGDVDKRYNRLLKPERPVPDVALSKTSQALLQPLMDHLEWR